MFSLSMQMLSLGIHRVCDTMSLSHYEDMVDPVCSKVMPVFYLTLALSLRDTTTLLKLTLLIMTILLTLNTGRHYLLLVILVN